MRLDNGKPLTLPTPGNASGGKFFGKTGLAGPQDALGFSNRDEVAIMKKVIADYNNMDLEGA